MSFSSRNFLSPNQAQTIIAAIIFSIFLFVMKTPSQSESPAVSQDWRTFAEQTDYRKTPRYAETVAFAQKLDKSSDRIIYKSFGASGEGRDLPLLIAADDKTFTPGAVRKKGKAVVLIQACIHAGESDGKDAGLALLRDIAITKIRNDLLKDVVILFVPIYNVDGHENFNQYNRVNQNGPDEMGFRATSANLNLNRDYMKADAPETRAFLKLWNEWKPDFFIDCHVTDGADFRYNLTYEFAHHAEISPFVRDWMNEHFEKRIVPAVEREGNLLTHYLSFDGREVTKGVETFIPTPRFATGYTPLRNRAGLLIETHSLKPYKSRVRGTYDILRYTIEEINLHKASLFEANRRADAETVERGKTFEANRQFPLRQEITKTSVPFNFKGVEYRLEDSEISGTKRIIYGTKPLDITIPKFDEARISASVAPPLYYIVPPQWKDAIERLQAHGIEFQRLAAPLTVEVESYRFTEPKWSTASFENRVTLNAKANLIKETRTFPVNSVVVSLAQEAANVAVHLLEPNSPDSFFYWGFFNAIFEQKEYGEGYVLEKIAREMLAKDPNLRKEFEERLKDERFAKNPFARLGFFYERSPYFANQRIGIYPVGRVTTQLSENNLK
jgi:murein tripeptide amidase MpaA